MEQTVTQSGIRAHGTSQIEIKSHYPFGSQRKTRYYLQLYLVIPRQLGVATDVNGQHALLDRIRSNTRFQVANISMAQLGNPDAQGNPIGRIRNEILEPRQPGRPKIRRINYEIRTFCNLYVAQLKTAVRLIKIALQQKKQIADGVLTTRNFVRDSRKTLNLFRDQRQILLDPAVPDSIRTAFDQADEYLGGQIIRYLLTLSEVVSAADPENKLVGQIRKSTEKEIEYQKQIGYTSIREISSGQELEALVNRESRLKKWVQSTLYLNTEESGTPRRIGHFVASVAAATAMAIAVTAAFFADRLFVSYSLPWALLIVGSYILKDRIKEILRGILVRYVPSVISDRTRILIDPAVGKTVGRVRLAIRNGDPTAVPFLADSVNDESTLVISNAVTLKGRALSSAHQRVNGIVDITRIRIDQWLPNMDAPRKLIRIIKNGEAGAMLAPRTYRVRMVLLLSQDSQTPVERQDWWAVLNRNGIVRIELAEINRR